MKKIIIGFVLFLPFPILAQSNFTITASLDNVQDKIEKVYLRYKKGTEWYKDSALVANNVYTFKGEVNEPGLATLSDNKINTQFFIEASNIKITHNQRFPAISVSGSKADIAYRKLEETAKPYNEKLDKLYADYASYQKAKDKEGMQKTETAIDAIDAEMKEKVYGLYAEENKKSPIALYALQQYAGYAIDANKVEPLFKNLPAATKKWPSAIALEERIATAKKTDIGQMAIDFTQNDTLGNPVALSSFKGKYVLIDFWASWCGPCRAENPNVVAAYQQYHAKGFEVLGVSLDRPGAKEKWLKAINDDKLTWTQVSDLQFWNNAVAKLYGINAIPQNYLLDTNGKIIGKNLRGEELKSKLASIFNN